MGRRWYRSSLLLLLAFLLSSCGTGGAKAPVERRLQGGAAVPETHTVSRGETLFGIAWSYGLDYRSVAAANRITPPYVIYPGQRLRLSTSDRPAATPIVASGQSAPLPRSGPVAPPSSAVEGQPRRSAAAAVSAPSVDPAEGFDDYRDVRWVWPTAGPILSGFGKEGNKGVDIGGKRGQPVRAAAPGVVVYSGSGLIGYGKLIIVKHNKNYLSAYAHNDELLVEEGDKVSHGQDIARMGQTATGEVKLHFEIRKDGKPVNPLPLLPRSRPS